MGYTVMSSEFGLQCDFTLTEEEAYFSCQQLHETKKAGMCFVVNQNGGIMGVAYDSGIRTPDMYKKNNKY